MFKMLEVKIWPIPYAAIFIMIMCLIPSITCMAEVPYTVDVKIVNLGDNFANYYILHRLDSGGNKNANLLIYLDGSGVSGALGTKLEKKDFYMNVLTKLNHYYSADFDMLVPEKMNVELGKDGSCDVNVLSHYTLQDRVKSAISVLDTVLDENNYNHVVLVGASEGGAILPRVYNNLQYKNKVSELIVLAGGGLSQYEEFKILQKADLPIPPMDRNELMKVDIAMREIKNDPDSLEKTYYGCSYKYWSGFMSYRPLDEFTKIKIPILVIHGSLDINTPVESSRAIVKEFDKQGKTNLAYIEYKNWNHFFSNNLDVILKDIGIWLKQIPGKITSSRA